MEHTLTSTLTNLGPNASKTEKALRKSVKQVNIQTQYLEVDLMDHRAKVDRQLPSLLHSLHRFAENRASLPEDAIEERLVWSEVWLFQCQSSCLQRDERWLFRAKEFVNGGFSRDESVLGSGEVAQKNEVIASRASIERCVGLKLQISVTEITACLYIFNKQ